MKKVALLIAVCMALSSIWVPGLAEGLSVEDEGLVVAPGLTVEGDEWIGDVLAAQEECVVNELSTEALPAPNEAEPESDEETEGEPAEVVPSQTGSPHVDPNGPQLAENVLELGVGETFDLTPKMPEGQATLIMCATSNSAVAMVTVSGVVTAVDIGEAVITATAANGTYAECFVSVKKAPDAVEYNRGSLSIGVGETTDALQVKVGSVEGEFAGHCTYSSSNPAVATVDAKGAVKGVAVGTAVITATTYNGLSAACNLTVAKAPTKLTLSLPRNQLGIGETMTVKAKPPKKTACVVRYTSDKPAVATVDPLTGVVTGVASGMTVIRAESYNGKKAEEVISVLPPPQTLAFDQASVKLGVGMKLDVAARVELGAVDIITYSLDSSGVVKYEDGVLSGVKKGKATLVATSYNGLTASCAIQVVGAPKSVTLPQSSVSIGVGQQLQLEPSVGKSASTYTYSTSSKKIVTVSKDGVLKGVKKGNATVTVKTYNNKTVKLKVKVVGAPSSVALSPTSAELGVGEAVQLNAALSKGSMGTVSYSSGNPAVATVDAATGLVTAVAPGEAVITATTHNGKKATAKITVLSLPDSMEVDTQLIEMAKGMTHALKVTFPQGAHAKAAFASKNPRIATVSDEGVIKGVRKGTTVVTVSVPGTELTREVNVTVRKAPGSVKLEPTAMTLNVGETTQLNPVIRAGTLTEFTYKSSNAAVAQITAEGKVTALSTGTATLTVTTHNGKKATLALTVEDPWFPEKVTIKNAPSCMEEGATLQLKIAVQPETAVADLVWKSSDSDVAYVDKNDVLHAEGFGYAKITATSKRNSAITLSFTVAVQTQDVVLTIPARTTDVDGISKNLEKIEALRASAIRQIGLLYLNGTITQADAEKRKSIVNNAFKDYAFPWKTPKLQKYWKAENSEGGVKDFKTDRVYYGMPYISGSGTNRQYNAAKALSESRFTDSGKGYYLLNQNKLLNGKYCGNDCSCFVDAAIWGTNSSHSDDRTKDIAVSSAYKTIKDPKSLRTGDLICKSAAHVVMFLYYANEEKTKIMIIENGGSEPGTNTVHCIVMDLSYYTSRGYKGLRLASLG